MCRINGFRIDREHAPDSSNRQPFLGPGRKKRKSIFVAARSPVHRGSRRGECCTRQAAALFRDSGFRRRLGAQVPQHAEHDQARARKT
jgi:hypothetical protein